MRKIEGMGTEELVYVGGLLRMGGDSLLMPIVDLLKVSSLAKWGRSDVWLVRAGA